MVDSNPTDHTAHSASPAALVSAEEIAHRAVQEILRCHVAETHRKDYRLMAVDTRRVVDWVIRAAAKALTAELREARAQHLADLGQLQQPECYVDADAKEPRR